MSPSDTTQVNVTGHIYDGIEEYDNPMPGWWTWIFAASIAFAAVYFLFVMRAGGQLSPLGFYDRELTADAQRQFAQLGDIKSDPASILTMSKDDKLVRVGSAIFAGNCAACHGVDGAGITGPNLTDNAYIHVKTIGDIADVIRKGRNNGAMPAWENRLDPRQISLLASYVASLRGANRPGREAQGTVIPAWSAKEP
jgi:cytochrome c oxidase cbb3-type subunit 3